MRFGFATIPGEAAAFTALVRDAEAMGFHQAWVPDQTFHRDVFALLAACATEARRIALGVGVTNPFTRHPVQIARAAATVDEISGGRLTLGIGAGNRRELLRPLGLEQERTAQRCAEAVTVIKGLLRGERVTHESDTLTVRDVALDFAARARELAGLQQAFPQIRLVNGLEVNITIDGRLQVPDEVLAAHQFCLASIHTGFRQPREVITRRLLAALAHPAINGIAHPTGRLLLQREGVDADWDAVFEACLHYDKVLEIDGPADRLDLPDYLVREAVRRGVKLVVDSDAHRTEELGNVLGAVDVARRGWAGPANVLNTLPFAEFVHQARVRGVG
ncbi:MAG: LLM class flavin-dependent oxidoreductase [Firmicutes bacterium]|nr:LLM class flavin-dependent oxidoreductase [Bacillota bacterium]